jgi:hypothetical protein
MEILLFQELCNHNEVSMWLAMYNFPYLSGSTDCSPENWQDWLKQHLQILGLFHYILQHIVYYARITVINMQCGVNFLVHDLLKYYNIEKNCGKSKSVIYDVRTNKHTRIRQNKRGCGFQILITYLNANAPIA